MKNRSYTTLQLISACFLVLFFTACSTTKNTVMHRGWHNMNARYNGYFYSKDNLKESVKKVEKANKDDFSKLIPLFIYTDNQSAKSYYSDFDKTIKKSSVVIQHHAIKSKKTKEEIPNACRWIDENYMLIGKAHFYKRDLFSALEAFEYVSKKYPKPEAKYGAMLWMIRTNNEIGSLSQSELTIDDIRNAKDFPKERAFQQEYAAVSADYAIKREDYSPAIKHLTKAITLTRKKAVRARYIYVLAQLYEKQGDNKKASQYYSMVPGLHPPYDMAFSARINQAKLFDTSGDSKEIKKQLAKMLKDDKNIEFRDQIYYALAALAYKEKDVSLAVQYLDKSIRESTTNTTQKALSFLMRADIYFDKTEYQQAEVNYDSTMTFLPKDYPNYGQIDEKKKSLNSLVQNLNVIAMEDSLQRMAKLTEKQRADAIDKLIAKIEEDEKRKEEERQFEIINQLNNNNQTKPASTNQTAGSTAWYFYNAGTVGFGISEFTKKWGSRKLEDNWRRSEKEQVIAGTQVDEEGNPVDSVQAKNPATAAVPAKSKKDPNYYLKKIPLSPETIEKSNLKIVEAYYNLGSIYKEQLLNNAKSVATFEELLKKYPDNKYKLSCYYQLYRIYLSMNNKSKSDYYKNILLNEHPNTEYARIIKNPDYAKDVMASKSEVEKFYTETYQLYSEGKYSEALINCKKADTLYSKNYLMPQFVFIKALCIGRTQDINAFEAALTQVVIKYPKEPVKDKAQEMLDLIKKQKNPAAADTTIKQPETPKFIFKEDGDYYWVTIALNGKGDIDKFKIKLSDENTQSFSLEDLNVSNVFLDMNHQLISVKYFSGKAKAMDYYNFMKNKKDIFDSLEPGTYQSFIISAENYTTFYKEKNIEAYQEFFSQNFK